MHFRPGRALILIAAAVVLAFAARSDGPAVFVSRLAWTTDEAGFGGWSGLELSTDGSRFTAITDKGMFTAGRLWRSAGGRLALVEAAPIRPLADTDDGFFGRDNIDAEGLALAPDGRMLVSFEVVRRVLSYPDASGTHPMVLPTYRDFIGLRSNRGLEALAIGPDGALYTLPEEVRQDGVFRVYRFDGTRWRVFAEIADTGDGFEPVGADVGPDGRFYLLERKLVEEVAFATRVRRFEIAPDGLADETLLLRTRPGTHDNLEGLAVWRDGPGQIHLTMVSDDNFNRYQVTELVEYLVPLRLD